MQRQAILALGIWLGGLIVFAVILVRWLAARQMLRARMFPQVPPIEDADAERSPNGLAQWLFNAGYRRPRATAVFVGMTLSFGLFGFVLISVLPTGAAVARLTAAAKAVPGGVGEVLIPVILAGPWLVVFLFAALPTMAVRASRRRRIREVEQDLPIVLELLATLAEAGLGFDAAIERVRESMPPQRVLARELRAFHRDNLAGRPRVESLRWLGRRVAVTWFSIFISAVVHADQIGAGLAEVLKIQANDLRQRRKEKALAEASSAPVKLLLPMIVCFVPGMVTAALGPTLFEVVQTLESLMLHPR